MLNGYKNMKINTKLLISLLVFALISVVADRVVTSRHSNGIWDGVTVVVALLILVGIGYLFSRSLTKPITQLRESVSHLALGRTDVDINIQSKDEIGQLASLFKELAESSASQSIEAQRIAQGDLNVEVKLKSDQDKLGLNMELVVKNLRELIHQIEYMSNQHDAGDIEVCIPIEKFEGDYRKIAQKINDMVNGHITVKKKAMATVEQFAQGNFDAPLEPFPGKKAFINETIEKLRSHVKLFINEMHHMSQEHDAGDIDVVIDVTKFDGAYKTMAQGVNDMVNGHITVKKKAMATVEQFAEGNFDAPLEPFPGKKAFINETIEKLRSHVKLFINEMHHMSQEHDAGDIDVVIDLTKFDGAYKTMAQGVNDMVNGHITVKKKAMATIAQFVEGNFDAPLEPFPGKKAFINDNIEALRTNLKDINDEIGDLIRASKEGQLSQRANVDRFKGDWSLLISGLNGLIDAILEPIQEASEVLNELSKGNLKTRVKGNYKGDHARIKHALNDTLVTLSDYIDEISDILNNMAEGNMVVALTKDYRGDFTAMKSALNLIIQSFNDLLHEINNASSQVAAGSKQVSDSAQALAHGATEQASSLEQLTASVEEISTQTKSNAKSADEANKLSEQAKTNAIQGNEQMKHMLNAMDGINESSGNISKIIKVIDELAFQTNILALNAAVEAARAGQHGKGFAVVAEEVRNLAARSANAAKETTILIEGSVTKVGDGMKIANYTADALNKIVEDVAKATELVGQIARASNEQAAGISQINQGIGVVSDVTQTNSATSEESAAASEELSSQAETLRQMVSRFKLKANKGQTGNLNRSENEYQNYVLNLDRQTRETKAAKLEVAAGQDIFIDLGDKEFGKY